MGLCSQPPHRFEPWRLLSLIVECEQGTPDTTGMDRGVSTGVARLPVAVSWPAAQLSGWLLWKPSWQNKQHGWRQSHLQMRLRSCRPTAFCCYASSSHRPISRRILQPVTAQHDSVKIATSCSFIITLPAIERFLDPLLSCRDISSVCPRYSSSCLALFSIS